jgi:hypothetical protein
MISHGVPALWVQEGQEAILLWACRIRRTSTTPDRSSKENQHHKLRTNTVIMASPPTPFEIIERDDANNVTASYIETASASTLDGTTAATRVDRIVWHSPRSSPTDINSQIDIKHYYTISGPMNSISVVSSHSHADMWLREAPKTDQVVSPANT